MLENKKGEVVDLKKSYFFKIHEKVQSKYKKMQKKLDKSKSVDAISNLSEDFDYKEPKHSSTIDLRESDETESDRQSLTHSVIVEEVTTRNASFQDVRREASVSELVQDYMIIEKNDIENEIQFFENNFLRTSLESLNEASADSDGSISEPTTPCTPPAKISLRDRISSRLRKSPKETRKEGKMESFKENVKQKKKDARDKVEKFVLSNTKQDVLKMYKRTKVATVTIALIEASGLETDISEDKSRLLYCRFRLGGEKYKSKSKSLAAVVKWQELFNLNIYDEQMLAMSLWDKDSFIGRSVIDLSDLEKERTHHLRINLLCDIGKVEMFLLLTITGTSLVNTLVDNDDYEKTLRRLSSVRKQYAWYHVKNNTEDVGSLSVIVYGAKGLIGSENYCILEIGNERLQTQTESKTHDPNWMKIFSFAVNDITSILNITVHDEKKSEDIGKLSILLLDIKNGEKKWYALKEVTQLDRAKGNNPRILLEMRITWNVLRASLRVITPKEVKYLKIEEKLQRHTFARNLSRARAVVNWIMNAFRIVKTLFEWKSRKLNVIALTLWMLFCWFFKMWMLPLLFLVPFIWYRPQKYVFINWRKYVNEELAIEMYEDPKEEKEEKTSWRQKLSSLTDMILVVQNFIGEFASYGESIKNLFNFTVPFLSCLAIFMISVIAFVMYLIPVKYIFMVWGIHKFTRKILRPNRIPNNELLDLLSRVPDDETLLSIQEIPLEEVPEEDVIR